jgi:fructose-1,6-bisphosphatase II
LLDFCDIAIRQEDFLMSRNLDLCILRASEQAALAAWKWFGRGDKNAADGAAVRAIRKQFDEVACQGLVRIGEGLKDDAPGIFAGDRLGTWQNDAPQIAVALDPIDGTTLTAKGLPGAISVIAVGICTAPGDKCDDLFPDIQSYYMQKIAVGPKVAQAGVTIGLDAKVSENLAAVAQALEKDVNDLVAIVLDRPRHEELICDLRQAGCGIRLISDGDVAGAIAPSLPNSGVDLYLGIGGSPEAVISAAAIKCVGGQQYSRVWPKDETERQWLGSAGKADLHKVWDVDAMAACDSLLFVATGISDSTLLRGLRNTNQHTISQSMILNSNSRTIQMVNTYHSAERNDQLRSTARRPVAAC